MIFLIGQRQYNLIIAALYVLCSYYIKLGIDKAITIQGIKSQILQKNLFQGLIGIK